MNYRKLLFSPLAIILVMLLSGCELNMVVFEPQGPVARSIMELINWSLMWMLLVVVVVFGLFGYIVWKYRERPENKDYEPPEEHGSTLLEVIWTAIPILIVIALTIPTVKTLYDLEEIPKGYEEKAPITIHVTSADWKWIFSYPEQGIETVNYVNIPEDTPVLFKLTSASTMQSFWVPALGGQKYTMGKMQTQMYLVADHPGSYLGRNTNFNGRGYAEMEFEVLAQTQEDFDQWVKDVEQTAPKLTEDKYEELLKPTHLGRLTFSNTHLEWVNHAEPDSKTYTNPELYRYHGYQGKVFEEEDNYKNKDNDTSSTGNHVESEDKAKTDGGEHHGH
ncbi:MULTISPECIES: cytochrome aa3 quinol oxidase subunit II [unclassified Paenibacillus]|uniref:cytochrome aa3 quinol oxidase subunit II n=1 Tax=unclassified Paenibacillus TaxID=185978 RepID=UPI001AE500AA|nr:MULTISPECIES: cytochrome aa3 quinol oxidase subunit II [unclassified Paenibacillus]MBP1154252.1 cytochrome aa3-600 menaquinol oxidase subunit 2 [Paenibacillus sp. PvP091]MBP1170363.1 cytochrome aa3-600 menaquinol oxidase subunit 2 [Paenibacillus sp. PvR098]MBP2441391.1 cytochrome aa3-600 menaquinol oxidase subunit 2 [Paenibacillus sp. PvP052]